MGRGGVQGSYISCQEVCNQERNHCSWGEGHGSVGKREEEVQRRSSGRRQRLSATGSPKHRHCVGRTLASGACRFCPRRSPGIFAPRQTASLDPEGRQPCGYRGRTGSQGYVPVSTACRPSRTACGSSSSSTERPGRSKAHWWSVYCSACGVWSLWYLHQRRLPTLEHQRKPVDCRRGTLFRLQLQLYWTFRTEAVVPVNPTR